MRSRIRPHGNSGSAAITNTAIVLLRCDQVAERLSLSECALAQWKRRGIGPKVIRLEGRVVRYRESDIEGWIAEHENQPSLLTG